MSLHKPESGFDSLRPTKNQDMLLHCLGSESFGNGYILQSRDEVLLIEAGVRLNMVKAALDFDLSTVVGAIQSHIHGDHFKYAGDYAKAGINIYTSRETIEASGITGHRVHPIESGRIFKLGMFQILPFDVPHGVKCHGFLIQHPTCGKLLFATDCAYIPGKFVGLSTIMVECNYQDELLTTERPVGSHMSLTTCMDFLKATDMKSVRNIILLHLSSSHSNSMLFIREVKNIAPNSNVFIADKNMTISINRNPF